MRTGERVISHSEGVAVDDEIHAEQGDQVGESLPKRARTLQGIFTMRNAMSAVQT